MRAARDRHWVVAASARGPRLAAAGRPAEDACGTALCPRGAAIVVSDGVGSAPHARTGARLAVVVAKDAARRFLASPASQPEAVPRFIRSVWELSLGALTPANAAATCLLAVDAPGRGVFIWVLGDGLALRRSPDGTRKLTPERTGFGTETAALGGGRGQWMIATEPPLQPGESLLLATDGVADDLEPSRFDAFATWCVTEAEAVPDRRRSAWLLRTLQAWPVPHHLDDKSLAILHRANSLGEARGE